MEKAQMQEWVRGLVDSDMRQRRSPDVTGADIARTIRAEEQATDEELAQIAEMINDMLRV